MYSEKDLHQSPDETLFSELSAEQKEAYITSLVKNAGVYYDGHRHSYYHFGFPTFYRKKPKDRALLEEILQNPEKVLNDEEADTVYQAEINTYKIHVNVPASRKIDVLKALLAVQKKDNDITRIILEDKRKTGHAECANDDEIRAKGGRLVSINQYKMSDGSLDDASIPDFVFYLKPTHGQTAQDALVKMAHELNNVLTDLELPPTDRIPRFSTPVVIQGKEIPGMTFVQGNGDFKHHMLKTDRGDTLSIYYDKDKNWALRVGEKITFDI